MRVYSVSLSLLVSVCLALAGNGLLGTVVALRLADGGVGDAVAGVVLAGYFAGLMAGTLVLAPTISRVGHIRSFTAFTALGVAAALTHGLTDPSWGWVFLRALSGLCMAGVYMTVESWLNAEASPGSRGRVLAAYLVALYLGTGVGQLFVMLWPEQGLHAFTAAALLASLAAVPVALTRADAPRIEPPSRLATRELVSRAPLGWSGALVSGFVCATIYANVPLFARASGLDQDGVSLLMAAFVFGGLAGQWPIGLLSDRVDRRAALLCALAALLGLCALQLAGLASEGLAMNALAFVFGGLAFSLYPIAVAHTLDRTGVALALPAAGQLLLASSVGAVAGPIAASAAMGRLGPSALFAVDAGVILVLALAVAVRIVSTGRARQLPFRPVPRTTAVVHELDPRQPPTREHPAPRNLVDPAELAPPVIGEPT